MRKAVQIVGLKQRTRQLKTDIPAVFIAMSMEEVPLAAKILAGMTVGYALSPIDLIPDFVPILGLLDDLIILPVMVFFTVKLIPKNVLDQCREEAQGLWDRGKPKMWYLAVPIILFWLLIVWLLVKVFVIR